MKRSHSLTIAAPLHVAVALACLLLAHPARVFGFAEDLCTDAGLIDNCLKAKCNSSTVDQEACYFREMVDIFAAGAKGNGRSMVHTDSTYFMAQALGLRPDVAYWLAAYNEVVDVGQYLPFNRCGERVADTRWHSADLNGWGRMSTRTGGMSYHYSTFFVPTGGDTTARTGLAPDKVGDPSLFSFDPIYEGFLVHWQRWAFEDGPACVDGLTETDPANGSQFTGGACYQVDPTFTSMLIQGQVPLFVGTMVPFRAFQGNQIAYQAETAEGEPFCMGSQYVKPGIADACHATPLPDLAAIVAASTGKMQDGAAVPVEIARMGIFLHILMDRASHYQCGDESSISGPDADRVLHYSYGDVCTSSWHAIEHSMEVGKPTLAIQTYTALDYSYDELARWADQMRGAHPDWFPSGQKTIGKDDLIGRVTTNEIGESYYEPGVLPRALAHGLGKERLEAMNRAIVDAGYVPMPGNGSDVHCIQP